MDKKGSAEYVEADELDVDPKMIKEFMWKCIIYKRSMVCRNVLLLLSLYL